MEEIKLVTDRLMKQLRNHFCLWIIHYGRALLNFWLEKMNY